MRHYKQTTSYTCDPACLMMAMKELDRKIKMSKGLEINIWKDANMITVPGCLPQGLALSAVKRGFDAEIICKRRYMHETTQDDRISKNVARRHEKECKRRGVKLTDKTPTVTDMKNALRRKYVPLVLVSARKIHNIKSPHWIVVTKITKDRIHFHDPLLDSEMSLTREDFTIIHSQVKEFLNKRMLIISKK